MQQYKRPFVSPRCPLFRHKNRPGSWEAALGKEGHEAGRSHKASWQNHKKPVLLGCTVPGAMSAKDCPAANLSRAPTKKIGAVPVLTYLLLGTRSGAGEPQLPHVPDNFPLAHWLPMACVVSLWLSLRVLVFGSSAHGERDWAQADLSEKDIDYWALPARLGRTLRASCALCLSLWCFGPLSDGS